MAELTKRPKNAYDFICPKCGCDQYLKPSMAMQSGINSGHGSCLECKTFLHLKIISIKNHQAEAEIYDNYITKR